MYFRDLDGFRRLDRDDKRQVIAIDRIVRGQSGS